jgi:hypothetical protein
MNKIKTIKIILVGLFLLTFLPILAADDISFSASVNKNIVSPYEDITLTITVSGTQSAPTPKLPKLKDFNIQGTGSSRNFRWINGNISQEVQYQYILQPQKAGKCTIPSISLKYKNKTYKTDPIKIEVSLSGTGNKPDPKNSQKPSKVIFAKMSVPKKKYYINEMIPVKIKLYRHTNIRMEKEPKFIPPKNPDFIPDLTRQSYQDYFRQRTYRETIDGIEYEINEITLFLSPIKSGNLIIPPVQLFAMITVPSRRRKSRLDDFFSMPGSFNTRTTSQISIKTNPVSIEARVLPEKEKPKNFSGCVGKYNISKVTIKPDKVKAGNPITLKIHIKGEGNIKTIPLPILKTSSGFKIGDYTSETKLNKKLDILTGEKIFEQLIIPLKESIKKAPSVVFNYFDPEKEKYMTDSSLPIPVKILPAEKKPSRNLTFTLPSSVTNDIHFIKETPGAILAVSGINPNKINLLIFINLIPILGVIIIWNIERRKMLLAADKRLARAYYASGRLKKQMRLAKKNLHQEKTNEFYNNLSQAIYTYLGDISNLPPGESIVKENFKKLILKHKNGQALWNKLESILEECELARFASSKFGKEKMERSWNQTCNVLKKIKRKKLKAQS